MSYNTDRYEFVAIHRRQHEAASGKRAASETDGQPPRLDRQRRQRAARRGGPAPSGIRLRRFPRFPCRTPSLRAGKTLAIWEVVLLLRAYKQDAAAVARHLGWPEARVLAAAHYAEAFPEEIAAALADNDAVDFKTLKRMLPQAAEFVPKNHRNA